MNARNDAQPRVLYVETYPAGSHGRVLDLLIQHSTLHIDDIRCQREHWRWLAIAAHYELRDRLQRRSLTRPDLIICSGPLNVSAFVAMLPPGWNTIPIVVYFHESQWTYPSEKYDPRPYVLAHLDAVALADEAWFNSRFHLETFWSAATSPAAPRRVHNLARRLRPELEPKCRVIYPPVAVSVHATQPHVQPNRRLLWNARWELDKRPASFVRMRDLLASADHDFDVLVLGTGSADPQTVLRDLKPHAGRTLLPGHLESRAEYESSLASAGIFVSTAGHEFFGVAALEATLAGVIPVLPAGLAYPETLPSAYFYEPDDMTDLARIVGHLLTAKESVSPAHRSDASRYSPARTVPVFDEHCRRLIFGHRR